MENCDVFGDLSSVCLGDLSKSRRLMDIKRGRGYLKTIDSLAQEQWTTYGKTSLLAAKVPDLSLGPVKDRYCKDSLGRDKEVLFTDRINKKCASPFPNNTLVANSQGFTGVSQDKANGYSGQRKGTRNVGRTDYFNTWGSREWDHEDKLVPENYPRIIMPKQGIMMSRVAKKKNNHHFRTNTDFRSRNGTIGIINPPKPLPAIEQTGNISIVDSFDPETLKREQTYLMLKRIDQLLHPNRIFKQDVTSSEQEIRSTSVPSLSDSMDNSTDVMYSLNTAPTRRKTCPQNGLHKRQKTKEHLNRNSCPSLLSVIVQKLGNTQMDSYHKCEQWVDRCYVHFSAS